MLLVPGVFGAVLLPMMAKAHSQGREVGGRRFVAVTTYLLLLAAPVVAFGVSFSGSIIGLLYGAVVCHRRRRCLPGACSPVRSARSTRARSSLLVSADRQQTILLVIVGLGVLKLVLDLTLITRFGLHGAVAAIVIEVLVSSAAYLSVGMRVSGVQLEWWRLLRIMLAAAIAAVVAATVQLAQLPLLLNLVCGGIVLSVTYAVCTLLLRCWSEADIEQIRGLHRRFAAGRPHAVGRLLDWAGARAGRS